jgi:death-on-curing protein
LATEETSYLSYSEAVLIHILLMRLSGETHYDVFDRALIESALARPKQARAYEDADLIRQAATLRYGLIKNHPWVGGNKRTATAITNEFLKRNGRMVMAPTNEIIALVLAVEVNTWQVDETEGWLRPRVFDLPDFLPLFL